MIQRFFKILSAIVLLAIMTVQPANARPYFVQPPPQDFSYKSVHIPLPYFTGVDVSGNFQVEIKGHKPSPSATLSGGASAVNSVSAKVVNRTLVIRQIIPKKQHSLGRVRVEVDLPGDLTNLSTGGTAVVRGDNITSHGLNIVARDQSVIFLRGEMKLSHVQNNTSGSIDLAWVYNSDLLIDGSGSGTIRVAGTADVFTAHLAGSATLDARYLRAHDVYVSTQDYACAKVTPLHSLYAFANDHGAIYYYHKPHLMAGYTRCSGNVLYFPY